MSRWPPYLCGAANCVAAIALLAVLRQGTDLVPDPLERVLYVQGHRWAWSLGWASWVIAAVTLVLLYRWWARRIGQRGLTRVALAIALVGLACDLVAESALVLWVPEHPEASSFAFGLTGVGANGGYSIAGALLTFGTRPLGGPVRGVWTWSLWALGAALALSVATGQPLLAEVSSALLFVLFIPWCVLVAPSLG